MPRKGEVPKRKPLPDPKFTDQPVDMRRKVTKFVKPSSAYWFNAASKLTSPVVLVNRVPLP